MKNSLRLLSLVLSLAAGAWCQISGTISATSTDCSVANSCITMNLPTSQSTGYSGLMVSVTPSSYSGVLTFEVSDGTTWTVRQGYASTDNSTGVTTSVAGSNLSYQFNVSGWLGFRVRGSSYSSGSVVVKINPSPGSASSGHGSGSGGAVSSVTGAGTVSCSPTTGSVVCTGSGGASAGAANDVQIAGAGGTFAADTGIFTYTPSTHILNAGQGITTTSTGVATTLGLSGGTTPGSLPTNSFGWLGPSSATFTSYFFQCPTTPPTNGQTIVFGTQVGSVVPCTYATSATGNVSNSGTPLVHQPGIWVDSTHIAGGTAGTNDQIYMGSTGADPSFVAGPSGGTNGCAGTSDTPTYNTTTHAWGCHQITGGTGTGIPYAAGGGTADAQTVTLSPAWTSYVAGTCISWSPIAANATNTPTLAVNGLAALPIVRVGGGSPGINDLITTQVPAIACLDGTAANFQLQNPSPNGVINAVHTAIAVTTASTVNTVLSDDSFTPTVDGTYELKGIIAQTGAAVGCTTQGAVKFVLSGLDADSNYAYLQSVTTGWNVSLLNSGGTTTSAYTFLGSATPAAAGSVSVVSIIRRWKAGTAVHIGLLISTQPVACTSGQHTITDRVQIYKVQ